MTPVLLPGREEPLALFIEEEEGEFPRLEPTPPGMIA